MEHGSEAEGRVAVVGVERRLGVGSASAASLGCGLRDDRSSSPGKAPGHAFNDAIHVDAAMRAEDADNLNDGRVEGIAVGNRLGAGIVAASLPELGAGGSWSMC